MVGTDVRAKLAKFFTLSRVDNILQLVNSGKVSQQQLDIAEAAGRAPNYDVQSMFD